ncbi:phage tail tape measure protein [Pseudarthrobacter sp. PS3-L1]|uniref:phage tail tape measure protein n=1 Tax=Pseudarthrobacter sp. PS3-L1 TaxID=3046207 RepID=UPI0024BB4D8D|nr:phage tail tape measure protein [Pseudarthrobacter sp. PS3-L1]MDJ0321825.1 phage tail tape measure protein [Pseudarthrobacter sp. PS3-L1]
MTTRSARVVLELIAQKFISESRRAEQAQEAVAEAAEAAGRAADRAAEQAAQMASVTADAAEGSAQAMADAAKASAEAAEGNKVLARSHQDAATAAGLQYDQTGRLIDSNGRVLSSAQASAHGLESFSQAVYLSGEEAVRAAEAATQAADSTAAASAAATAAAEEYADSQKEAMETAGEAALAFGAISVGALGAATKAAMDWETAWTGVTKTVDGSPEQMAELESGLRDMAKTLPLSHDGIAAVAEAAGQLGVKREDVLKFTKTMIDLGETTNLTADEAATDIAQIANVMGTTGDEIDNFGATLVALGNDGASTEKDILSMAQRIAGAGNLVGATESDVLALSNTLASMGVKAELGGGVASRALLKMYAAVKSGGGELDAFAKAAGTSAEEFATKFAGSPVQALDAVTQGLGRTKAEGGNVVEMLKDMGLKGTEEMQVMLALSGAGTLLAESLELGNKAWAENTALLNEAAKRYDTTESKVTVAWNNIKDASIDAGAVMLPVVANIAESITGLAQGFGDLPTPLQGAITGFVGFTGTAALVTGGVLTMIPKIKDAREAFRTLNTDAEGGSRGLGKFVKAAVGIGAAVVAFEAFKGWYNDMQPAQQTTEDFTAALLGLEKQGNSVDEAFASIKFGDDDNLQGKIGNVGQALKTVEDMDFSRSLASFGATSLGVENGMSKIIKAFENQDKAIAGSVSSGNIQLAQKGFKAIADSAAEQGVSLEDTGKRFPLYIEALKKLSNDAGAPVTDQMELLNWAMGKTPKAMEEAAAGSKDVADAMGGMSPQAQAAAASAAEVDEALADVGLSADGAVTDLSKFTDALFAAGLIQLSARDAARGFEEAIDAVGASAAANGTSMDISTEKGRANQAALDGIASSGYKLIEANAKNNASQEELQGNLSTTYQSLIDNAGQFGIVGDAAIDLAREILKVPEGVNIDTWMSDQAKSMAQDTTGAVADLDQGILDLHRSIQETPDKTITITEPMSPEVIAKLENLGYVVTTLPDGTIQVGEEGTDATGQKIDNTAGKERIALINAVALTGVADAELERLTRPRSASLTLIVGETPAAPAGIAAPGRAGGGDLDSAPGPVGQDSKLFYGAKGEHVLTAREVAAMGGQRAVYSFRSDVRAGRFQHLAGGGTIGTQAASAQVMQFSATPSAGAAGDMFDMSGAVFQALDPAALQRSVVDEVIHTLNRKAGMRIA